VKTLEPFRKMRLYPPAMTSMISPTQLPTVALIEQLSDALARLGAVSRGNENRRANAAGLTALQASILAHLAGCESAPTISRLAAELVVTPATVSDAVATLVRKGLVAKRAADQDRRALVVSLTEAGEKLANRVRSWPDPLAKAMIKLPTADLTALERAVAGLLGKLAEAGELPSAPARSVDAARPQAPTQRNAA
jgi:DNA-binding MarR family transcriptional regulator